MSGHTRSGPGLPALYDAGQGWFSHRGLDFQSVPSPPGAGSPRPGLGARAAADLATRRPTFLTESTYGSRIHPPIEESAGALKETIRRTSRRGGKVIIPAFAVERTQRLVYLLNKLYNQGELPEIPIYVDSPLAVNVTDIFRQHTAYFDAETRDYLRGDPDRDIFGFTLRYIRDVSSPSASQPERPLRDHQRLRHGRGRASSTIKEQY
jgi:Cft2 family RNA processing exonuclease